MLVQVQGPGTRYTNAPLALGKGGVVVKTYNGGLGKCQGNTFVANWSHLSFVSMGYEPKRKRSTPVNGTKKDGTPLMPKLGAFTSSGPKTTKDQVAAVLNCVAMPPSEKKKAVALSNVVSSDPKTPKDQVAATAAPALSACVEVMKGTPVGSRSSTIPISAGPRGVVSIHHKMNDSNQQAILRTMCHP